VRDAVFDAKQAHHVVEKSDGFAIGETTAALTLVLALEAGGEPDAARTALAAAKARLLARADRLGEWRQAFLMGVPDNRELLRAAAERGL
jgi:hypothetical protein